MYRPRGPVPRGQPELREAPNIRHQTVRYRTHTSLMFRVETTEWNTRLVLGKCKQHMQMHWRLPGGTRLKQCFSCLQAAYACAQLHKSCGQGAGRRALGRTLRGGEDSASPLPGVFVLGWVTSVVLWVRSSGLSKYNSCYDRAFRNDLKTFLK